MINAKVIKHSINPWGQEIITVEATYPRFIHSELMTHRLFARNAASSRAIPFIKTDKNDLLVENCTYYKLLNDPVLPLTESLREEQKGMQSGDLLPEDIKNDCLEIIKDMLSYCLEGCERLFEIGLHKSIINRYLEPWSWITTIITATNWSNFFKQRCHPAAEIHFQALANKINEAIQASDPGPTLAVGEWHLPYISEFESDILKENLPKISSARCARVSYLNHEGQRNLIKDLELFDKLVTNEDGVNHWSPLEHPCRVPEHPGIRSGPFTGWEQYRKIYSEENNLKECW